MNKLRTIIYGVGAMGSNIVRLLQMKPQVEIVGAIDHDPLKIGVDLGKVAGLRKKMGIHVDYPARKVLGKVKADLVLHATSAFLEEAFNEIMEILEKKLNLITICQELFFPLAHNIKKAQEINILARKKGVRVTAAGINPGFIMDIVPIVCSLPCWKIEKVFVTRIVDFSPYGQEEMKHIGANLTPEEFKEGVRRGKIGHIGLLETAAMVSHCLGLKVDELRQSKEPVVTKKKRESKFIKILPGRVCGFKQNVEGYSGEKLILDFRMVGIVSPDEKEDGIKMGDHARLEGIPSVDIAIKEEIAQKGGLGTAGVAVNLIPKLMNSEPGFHTMHELSLPHIWNDSSKQEPIKKITYF